MCPSAQKLYVHKFSINSFAVAFQVNRRVFIELRIKSLDFSEVNRLMKAEADKNQNKTKNFVKEGWIASSK